MFPPLQLTRLSAFSHLFKMSFGDKIGDIVGVSRLALQVVANCRKACGEHDVLTREVTSLHAVLSRLEAEATRPQSLLSGQDDSRKEDLNTTIEDCRKVLSVLDTILEKYNALSEDKRPGKRLWSKIRFGNGEMQDLSDLRAKISTYTSAITLQLNLISLGSQGRVEREISYALPEIRESLNWITAKLSTGNEGTILTSYSGDDKVVWKELRRELILEGFASPHIRKHKVMIMNYIKELGDRGVLDDLEPRSDEQFDIAGDDLGNESSAGNIQDKQADISDDEVNIKPSPEEPPDDQSGDECSINSSDGEIQDQKSGVSDDEVDFEPHFGELQPCVREDSPLMKTVHFVDTKSAADEGVLTPESSLSPHENTNSALSISTPISIASNEEK